MSRQGIPIEKNRQHLSTSKDDQVTIALALKPNLWIREEASRRGWRLVNLWYSEYQLPEEIVPQGALITNLPDDPDIDPIRKLGIPIIRLGKFPHPADDDMPAVLPDIDTTGKLAADHFYERGFKNVAYFGNTPWSDGRTLFEAFRKHSEELGMTCYLKRYRRKAGEKFEAFRRQRQEAFRTWLQVIPKPLGLLAPGSYYASMYSACAEQVGLKVPSDVSILAYDNTNEICECSIPTISYIMPNEDRRVQAAFNLLESLMTGEPAPRKPILIAPKGVIERESTSVLATSDKLVASALRVMWDHLDLDLSVEDIAQEVGLSSRQLNRRFHKALNRSMSDEILRKRLEEVKRYLRTTDLAIATIGPMVGLRSINYLHRKFRMENGMTPNQYRQRHS